MKPETPAPWLCPLCGARVETYAHRCRAATPEKYIHSSLLAEWRAEQKAARERDKPQRRTS